LECSAMMFAVLGPFCGSARMMRGDAGVGNRRRRGHLTGLSARQKKAAREADRQAPIRED
jgi:hypothetical protein